MRNPRFFSVCACVMLALLTAACDIEPSVVEKRIFIDTASGATNPWVLHPQYTDPDGNVIQERLCIKTTDAFDAKGSGLEWLKQDIPNADGSSSGVKGGPIAYVTKQINNQLDLGIRAVFEAFSTDNIYKDIVLQLMTFVVIIYGVGLIGGVIPTQPAPLMIAIAKIAVVFALVTNYDFFKEVVQDFFEGLVDGFIVIMSEVYNGVGNGVASAEEIFDPANESFTKFFSVEFTVIMLALLTTGWPGFFFALTLLLSLAVFTIAVLRAVFIYLIALVARSLLYALAPVFLLAILFRQTRSLFDGWLQQVVSFTLQPILLYAFLGIFYILIREFLLVLNTPMPQASDICYMEYIKITGTNIVTYWWSFTDANGILRVGGTVPMTGVNIVVLFTLMVMSYIMMLFGTWAVDVASHMAQGLSSAAGAEAPGWGPLRDRLLSPVSAAAGGIRGLLGGETRDRFGSATSGGASDGADQGSRASNTDKRRRVK